MKTLTVSSKHQIVIPRAVRTRLGVTSGDKLIVDRISDTEFVLKKEPRFADFIGTLKTLDVDPVKRVQQIRKEWND